MKVLEGRWFWIFDKSSDEVTEAIKNFFEKFIEEIRTPDSINLTENKFLKKWKN